MNANINLIEATDATDIFNPYTGNTVGAVYFVRGGRRRDGRTVGDVLAANPFEPLVALMADGRTVPML